MRKVNGHPIKIVLSAFITIVWIVNGLFCKILNLVPRHQLIVARILGDEYASILTKTIGVLEVLMAIWIVSGIKSRWCTIFQIIVVATMNLIEFILAPDLLLFGRWNAAVAIFFILILYINEYVFTTTKADYRITQ